MHHARPSADIRIIVTNDADNRAVPEMSVRELRYAGAKRRAQKP